VIGLIVHKESYVRYQHNGQLSHYSLLVCMHFWFCYW